MPRKHINRSDFFVDFVGFTLNGLFWFLISPYMLFLLVLERKLTFGTRLLTIAMMCLLGLAIRWFSKGILARKQGRIAIASFLLIVSALAIIFSVLVKSTTNPTDIVGALVYALVGLAFATMLAFGINNDKHENL